MATINVLDATSNVVALEKPLVPGRAAAAASRPVALSTEDLSWLVPDDYETVAASASNQMLGATGAAGDFLATVLIIPASTSPGAVSIKDGGGSAIPIFDGGTVSALIPFPIPINARSTAGGWAITTGAAVRVFATGSFT